MPVTSLEDMFVYQLEEMYGIENELVGVLDAVAAETGNEELSQGFADHRDETREHVARIESVFHALGREPVQRDSATLEGMRADHERFVEEAADRELVDIFNLGAGLKTERMEITAYESLTMLAGRLDYGDAVTDPLEQNLEEEESTRTELKTLAGGSKLETLVQNLL